MDLMPVEFIVILGSGARKARMRKRSLDWMLENGAIYLEEKLEVNSNPKETTGTK